MSIGDWIPATVVTGAWSLVLWHYKERVGAYLTKGIQHNFDVRLAAVQSEFREKEAQFQADLRAKEKQMELLRTGALSALSSRQSAVDKRRLEAVDQIWEALTALAPARATASWMATFKMEPLAEAAANNPDLRKFLATFDCDPMKLQPSAEAANKARPFITPIAWAFFRTYQSIVMFAVAQSKLLQTGLKHDFLKTESMIDLVKQALPEYSTYLDEHGFAAANSLLDKLEERLLTELRASIDGAAQDEANVERAAKILSASRKVEADLVTSPV